MGFLTDLWPLDGPQPPRTSTSYSINLFCYSPPFSLHILAHQTQFLWSTKLIPGSASLVCWSLCLDSVFFESSHQSEFLLRRAQHWYYIIIKEWLEHLPSSTLYQTMLHFPMDFITVWNDLLINLFMGSLLVCPTKNESSGKGDWSTQSPSNLSPVPRIIWPYYIFISFETYLPSWVYCSLNILKIIFYDFINMTNTFISCIKTFLFNFLFWFY